MPDDIAPARSEDVSRWARAHHVSIEEARVRFAQYAMLSGIGRNRAFHNVLVFKGGNALDFIWSPNRSTRDLDFTVNPDHDSELPDHDEVRMMMATSLRTTLAQHGLTARIQKWESFPRRPGNHRFSSIQATVGFALADQPLLVQRIQDEQASPQIIPMDISFSDPVCAFVTTRMANGTELSVATSDDIAAEKLRALLQQPLRNRSRRQDVLDLAVLIRAQALDAAKVADFLLRKSVARDVVVSKAAFREAEIRQRASDDYDQLEALARHTFIPFDDAFATVLAFVDELAIPA